MIRTKIHSYKHNSTCQLYLFSESYSQWRKWKSRKIIWEQEQIKWVMRWKLSHYQTGLYFSNVVGVGGVSPIPEQSTTYQVNKRFLLGFPSVPTPVNYVEMLMSTVELFQSSVKHWPGQTHQLTRDSHTVNMLASCFSNHQWLLWHFGMSGNQSSVFFRTQCIL